MSDAMGILSKNNIKGHRVGIHLNVMVDGEMLTDVALLGKPVLFRASLVRRVRRALGLPAQVSI